MSGAHLDQALELADRFVRTGQESDTVTVGHPLIGQTLRARLRKYGELAEFEEAFTGWGYDVLDALFAHTLPPARVPGYLIRHLAAHLLPDPDTARDDELASSFADAYRLTHPLWGRARDLASDDLDGYHTDVARVAARARLINARAVQAGRPPPCLPEQVCCGMTVAYELIRQWTQQAAVTRAPALADLVTQIPSHALPEWLAQVHLILGDPYDRGPLWAIMNDRWPELTREQLWEVLDRWTSELAYGSRFSVCADILHYKYVVRALSGPQECERILDLLGIRVAPDDGGR